MSARTGKLVLAASLALAVPALLLAQDRAVPAAAATAAGARAAAAPTPAAAIPVRRPPRPAVRPRARADRAARATPGGTSNAERRHPRAGTGTGSSGYYPGYGYPGYPGYPGYYRAGRVLPRLRRLLVAVRLLRLVRRFRRLRRLLRWHGLLQPLRRRRRLGSRARRPRRSARLRGRLLRRHRGRLRRPLPAPAHLARPPRHLAQAGGLPHAPLTRLRRPTTRPSSSTTTCSAAAARDVEDLVRRRAEPPDARGRRERERDATTRRSRSEATSPAGERPGRCGCACEPDRRLGLRRRRVPRHRTRGGRPAARARPAPHRGGAAGLSHGRARDRGRPGETTQLSVDARAAVD